MTPNLSLMKTLVGNHTAVNRPVHRDDTRDTARDEEWAAARTVQERIFPAARPAIPGLDYFGDWRPAGDVSGDYLDYFEMSQGNLGLAVGDVSCKGLPAAPLTSSLHSMVRALRFNPSSGLPELVRTIHELFREICPDNCYATLFVARYDPAAGRLHYVNAGHEPPFVLRGNAGHYGTIFLESGGPVIGMLRKSTWREGVVSLSPGDVMVAYTDGLCDTRNRSGEEFGWPRFVETIEASTAQKSRDIVEGVIQAAETFAEGAPQYDDVTLWVGRVEDAVAQDPRCLAECVAVAA